MDLVQYISLVVNTEVHLVLVEYFKIYPRTDSLKKFFSYLDVRNHSLKVSNVVKHTVYANVPSVIDADVQLAIKHGLLQPSADGRPGVPTGKLTAPW